MRKLLLFVIAISLSSVVLAFPCDQFVLPNRRGCLTCPVTDQVGQIITCEKLIANHEPITNCCWDGRPTDVKDGCTTDFFEAPEQFPESCRVLFSKFLDGGKGDKGGAKGGAKGNTRGNSKNAGKAIKANASSVKTDTPAKTIAPVKNAVATKTVATEKAVNSK